MIIVFIGSVFSPYYAWRRRSGPADPTAFCAVNVALYGPAGRWAMTERGAGPRARASDHLAIGPSQISWDRGRLTIAIDEIAVPIPRRVRGTVTVTPTSAPSRPFHLDADGHHRWRPIAPAARVEARFTVPDLSWSGHGYCDTNDGDRPLERDFLTWNWSREVRSAGGRIHYDARRVDGGRTTLALGLQPDGRLAPIGAPAPVALPRTGWHVTRETPAAEGHRPKIIMGMEDAPFYARAVVSTDWGDGPATFVHEALSLPRFSNPVVQAMLPFRMPRRAGS